jgi:hypothetical protein
LSHTESFVNRHRPHYVNQHHADLRRKPRRRASLAIQNTHIGRSRAEQRRLEADAAKTEREEASAKEEKERQRQIKLNLVRKKAAYKATQNGENPEAAASKAERDFLCSCADEQAKVAEAEKAEAEKAEAEFEVVKQQQAKRQFRRRGSVHEMQDFMIGHNKKSDDTKNEIRQSFEQISKLQAKNDTRQSRLGGRLTDVNNVLADQAKVLAIFDQMKALADANKRFASMGKTAQMFSKWARGMKTKKMIEAMKRRLHLMGYPQRWSQYVEITIFRDSLQHTSTHHASMNKVKSQPVSPTSTSGRKQPVRAKIPGRLGRAGSSAILIDSTNTALKSRSPRSPVRYRGV